MTLPDDHTYGSRVSVRDVLFDAERRLTLAGVPSPSVDAAEIVAHVMGTTRTRLFLQEAPTDEQKVQIEQLLARRLSRVPLQHLLGTAAFRYLEVEVGPGVFIPRPETELLAEAGLRALTERPEGERIAVDLCSGSGILALALATEAGSSIVHAVEFDDDAVVWTRRNVEAHADLLAERGSAVTVHHADAGEVHTTVLADLAGRVDVVVSNPPYIPDQMIPREPEVRDHEPAAALYGGADGLDVVRRIARAAAVLLRPGGLLALEHADVQGTEAGESGVPGVLAALVVDADLAGPSGMPVGERAFVDIADRIDLNGLPRLTLARKRGPAPEDAG